MKMNQKYDIGVLIDVEDIILKRCDKDSDYNNEKVKLPEIEFEKTAMDIIEYFENKNIMEKANESKS